MGIHLKRIDRIAALPVIPFRADQVSSNTVLSALVAKHFPNGNGQKTMGKEYRQTMYNFLKEAEESCIPLHVAWRFKENVIHAAKTASADDISKGQWPSFIGVTNNPHAFMFSIFVSKNKEIIDGALVGGGFGHAARVDSVEDLQFPQDAITIKYMCNHMIHGGKLHDLAPFIPVEFTTDGGENGQNSFELGYKRRGNLVKTLQEQGHIIIENGKTPYMVLSDHHGKAANIFLPLLEHDIAKCEYFVREGESRVPFEEWVSRESFESSKYVPGIIEAVEEHKTEAGYFKELVYLSARAISTDKCVDSRTGCAGSGKDLAAIKSHSEKVSYLKIHSPPEHLDDLHLGCGALSVGMAFHQANSELKQIYAAVHASHPAEAKSLYGRYREEMGKIFAKSRGIPLIDIATLISTLETLAGGGEKMSDGSKELLKGIFVNELSDLQDTVRGLMKKGVFRWLQPSNQYVMASADWVLRKQARVNGVPIISEKYTAFTEQVILFEAYRQQLDWEKAKKEAGVSTVIKVGIDDLKDRTHLKVVKREDNRLIVVDFHTNEPI